ncbi:MAG: aminotransferase class I/II-fold pyridoxal phosphate-dependent enzyme, partial [Myxococcales bacterium]|nr:aminotransferase class I/II-fold pyridoxal phosphate-dependent enzyme [Myxococcales bacterium]
MDVFAKCDRYTLSREVRAAGIYPYYRAISSAQDPVVTIDGEEVVMLGSNNYLGLTNHPEVKAAAIAALERYGTGCAGSRLLNGTLDIHVEMEERLAAFMRRDAVLSFSTGYQVNVGVLSCLLDRHDTAFLDNLDHASIIDGVRLSFGKALKFKHNDMEDLAEKLANSDPERGRIIVVDGIFSMEGDIAKLPDLVRLKKQYGARLMVDDAHGLGVLGDNGRGTGEHFGLEHEVDLVMGTFSKSLAAIGGFIAGGSQVVEYIKHHARAEIFSAAPPPASCAAVTKALEIIEREPERRKQLWENTEYMKRELEGLGFDTGVSNSPVIPMVVGDDLTAFTFAARLQDEGVFANPVITPAVPPGEAMIRTSYMATHRRPHLDRAL